MNQHPRRLLQLAACIAALALCGGCFNPARVVELKLYPSPIFGHVDLDRDLTGSESFTVDTEDVQRMLPRVRWWPIPAGCKGCWLATMKLDNGREYRIRLDRFRYWFTVQGHPGCYVFPHNADRDEWRAVTEAASEWIHENSCRWIKEKKLGPPLKGHRRASPRNTQP